MNAPKQQQANRTGNGNKPPRSARMPGMKFDRKSLGVLKRVFGYVFKYYKFSFFMVVICIVVSAAAILVGNLFLQTLIDDYIIPLTQQANPDFSGLQWALTKLALFLALGAVCTYGFNRIMVNISQGSLLRIRQ